MNIPNLTLSQTTQWISGHLHGADAIIKSVETDSRCLNAGALFVALQGPNFDGHDFVSKAAAAGAVGAITNRVLEATIPQIIVNDTQKALEKLATAWRTQLPGRVISITGSNGKTTTKELIASVLRHAGTVAATQGNLNNSIGVPLTLLRAKDQDFLVVEMGANHPGEIATLSAIAQPDVAMITNAGRAHLEGFGSVEGVAKAKGEILSGLGPDGVCVLNADDKWLPLWQELAGTRKVLTFGRSSKADITVDTIETPLRLSITGFHSRVQLRTPRGLLNLDLALAGDHNLLNALATVAVAEALELQPEAIQAGLWETRPVSGRLQPLQSQNGAWLIDDSYNANPDSVKAALEVLRTLPGQHWLALGDLAELGPQAINLHRELGKEAKNAGLDHLWAVGPLSAETVASFGAGGRWFPDREALSAALKSTVGPQDIVLIKGSRSSGMEHVVQAL